MSGDKTQTLDVVRERLGPDRKSQHEALSALIEKGWRDEHLNMVTRAWRGPQVAQLPPEMREQLETQTLMSARHWPTLEIAAKEAARQVGQGWKKTDLGLHPVAGLMRDTTLLPGSTADMAGPATGVVIDAIQAFRTQSRMVPKAWAPENYVALHGKGTSDRAPDAEWVAGRLPALLKAGGASAAVADDLRLGSSAFFMPIPSQEGQFYVWRANDRRQLVPVGAMKDGVETANPLIVDLKAEAARLTTDFQTRRDKHLVTRHTENAELRAQRRGKAPAGSLEAQ